MNQDVSSSRDFPVWRRLRYRVGELLPREPIIWWRHRNFIPADVFVGTYPRSGYTWLRFMVYSVFTGEITDFKKVNGAFRYVGEHASSPGLLPGGGRFISTHESYRKHYKRAIYIVR